MRTIPGIKDQLEPLENTIRKQLILELLKGQQCNNKERKLLALPSKFGGLGIINPVDIAQNGVHEFKKVN